ncbi:MAG TPA: hypothetical protein VF244_04620 [Acidimicrobiales bacterium]
MKRVLVTVVSGMALLLGVTAPATAATTGAQSFTIYFIDDAAGTVVAKGPVAGTGTETEISNDGEGTGIDLAVFKNGSVKILHTETDFSDSFNESTCVGRFRGEGDYTLISGTGAYKGVSGSGTFSYKGTFFASRTADGCSEDGTSIVIVKASGTTTLP